MLDLASKIAHIGIFNLVITCSSGTGEWGGCHSLDLVVIYCRELTYMNGNKIPVLYNSSHQSMTDLLIKFTRMCATGRTCKCVWDQVK